MNINVRRANQKLGARRCGILDYGKIAVIPIVNLGYTDEAAKRIKAAKGYVSRFVGAGGDEERITWETTPPSTVKCMPSYQNQTWLPWEE